MNYRGIDYDIQVGIDRAIVWVVKTPKPQRGTASSRYIAIVQAKRFIDAWCRKHPEACEPKSPEVIAL